MPTKFEVFLKFFGTFLEFSFVHSPSLSFLNLQYGYIDRNDIPRVLDFLGTLYRDIWYLDFCLCGKDSSHSILVVFGEKEKFVLLSNLDLG